MKTILLLFAVICLSVCVAAQTTNGTGPGISTDANTSATGGKVVIPPEKSKPINISKTINPPVIDGRIDEDVWKQAAVFKDFYQTGPGYNTAPSKPTEVYMMYDDHNLYIAFKCWDEKDKIRASVAKRDNVFGEDNVRIWLDTYNDQRRAYVLGFNPLGIQQDGIFTEGNGADFSVDIVMESKGVIEDWGWSVEVKVPFKSIRYTAGKGKLWGFNAARNIDRFNDEFDQWLPDDRDISGFLVKHGKIEGLDEIKYERTLEIVPSITLSETGERVSDLNIPTGRFVNHQIKKDIGVNLKYTLSPNVTLDAAINPDYAEIEADAPVVSANQRFPIFFQEKRPFFLEGKDIFDSPLQPFYSRTIVDPDVALKLTGKINKTSFGILAASDNAPGNYSEDERTRNNQCLIRQLTNPSLKCPIDEFLDKNALFGVLRLKRDFGANNNIGFFSTARVFPKNRNFVSGIDGTFKVNNSTVMTFQALATHSRKNFYSPIKDIVEYKTGNGFGYFWSLDHTKESSGWYAEIFGRTNNYRADSGFTRRTNTNQAFFAYRVSTKSRPKSKIIQISANGFTRYIFDMSGRTQGALLGANLNIQAQGSLFMNIEGGEQYEKNYEEEFGAKRNPAAGIEGAFYGAPTRSAKQPYLSFNINKNVNKQFSLYGFVGSIWNSFDYDFGGGNRYPRASAAYQAWVNSGYVGPEPALDPGPGHQFDLNIGFTYKPINPLTTSLDYTKSKLRRNDTGLLAYDTNIFTWRTTYQFTRFTFARVRWDYDTLSSRAAGQFLVGWNPNPGTAFYVGYNDSLNYNGFNPYTGAHEPGFSRNSRTFFIRASYLFRKSF
ncbi:MAG: carbohydrate binding family 9 domain-containing protein [Pyrinomonadaceae bacterium]|nr:carbohydrate binding family 9 domain-containing protein [Pyrinomonadaceae bacterium]